MNFVVKQIKKKTLSFKMKVLNICLDLGNSVKEVDTPQNIELVLLLNGYSKSSIKKV